MIDWSDDPSSLLLCQHSAEVCDCEDAVIGDLGADEWLTLLIWRAMWRHTAMERGDA